MACRENLLAADDFAPAIARVNFFIRAPSPVALAQLPKQETFSVSMLSKQKA
jgi:hypothetical protein